MSNEIEKKRVPWSDKERKFILPKNTRWDIKLLPIIQNLVSVGMTEADIGSIVGFQGKNSEDWLNELKRHHPEVKDACAIGKAIADSFLVAQMYRSAVGYEYLEEEWRRDKDTGEMVLNKQTLKHQPANASLAMFIATNHMPEQYKNKVETTKRSFIVNASAELSSDQISKLAGKLIEEADRVKQIENTEIIETEFIPEVNDESTN